MSFSSIWIVSTANNAQPSRSHQRRIQHLAIQTCICAGDTSVDVHSAEASAPAEQHTGEAAAPSQQKQAQELFGASLLSALQQTHTAEWNAWPTHVMHAPYLPLLGPVQASSCKSLALNKSYHSFQKGFSCSAKVG